MFNKIQKQNKGFTLVEVMVSLMMFTFVVVVALSTLIVSNNSAKKSVSIKTVIDNIQYSMELFTRTARLGSAYTCIDDLSISSGFLAMDTVEGENCITGSGQGVAFYVVDPTSVPNVTDRYAFYMDNKLGTDIGRIVRCIERDVFPGGVVVPSIPPMSLSVIGNSCQYLTSEQIDIKNFEIDVQGATLADQKQPSIKVKMYGIVNAPEGSTDLYLQTFISQRQYE